MRCSGEEARALPSTGGRRAATFGAAALFVLSACAAEPTLPKCTRIDVPSMGPENSFRVSVAAQSASTLAGNGDRIDIAMTMVPPIDGPVTLVHTEDGRETGRWQLKVGLGSSISTRCRLGATPALSTCSASIGNLPRSSAGEWSVEPGSNRLLEAGLAFRTCR